jgi:hypothetical protein
MALATPRPLSFIDTSFTRGSLHFFGFGEEEVNVNISEADLMIVP